MGFYCIIYISALVILSGEWLIDFLEASFGLSFLLLQTLRFALLFVLLLMIIFLVYNFKAPRERSASVGSPARLSLPFCWWPSASFFQS